MIRSVKVESLICFTLASFQRHLGLREALAKEVTNEELSKDHPKALLLTVWNQWPPDTASVVQPTSVEATPTTQ